VHAQLKAFFVLPKANPNQQQQQQQESNWNREATFTFFALVYRSEYCL